MKTEIYTLNQLGTVSRGKSKHRPRNDAILYGGNYPFIQTGDIKHSSMYITEYSQTYNETGLAQSKLWDEDTLCITIAANIAETAILKIKACFPDSIVGFIANKEKADVRFVKYYFDIYKLYMQNISKGTTQDNFSLEKMLRVKFNIPSLSIQQKIANILSRYDEAIENNNKRIKLLEQMAQNLYKEWFVRFRFPGWQNAEFENGIPKEWNIQKLDEFGITLESGSRPSGGVDTSLEDGIPSLGAECINGLAEFDYLNVKYVPEEYYEKMKRGKNKGNHILVYKDGAYIGKVTLFRNKFPFEKYAINEHVFFLNTNNSNYLNWLYFTLKQESYFNLMQNLNRNAAQPGLSQPDIGRIKIRIPSEEVVIKFNEFVEPIFNTVFDLARANQNLAKQRDLLLPRLMSGKLEVK